MPDSFQIKLLSRQLLAPGVAHFCFQRCDGAALDYQPGQFIQLHFHYPDGTPTKRSYSLAGQRADISVAAPLIEFAASFVPGGAASALLQALPEGGVLEASGPYGRFCLQPGERNARTLLIATGTGVTPYRAMLPQLAQRMASDGLQVVLLQGARTQAELLYHADFLAFAARHPGFRYLPCVSRQWPVDVPGASQGHVQSLLPGLALDPEGDIAYVCGNPLMVDAVFEALRAAGLRMAAIRREKYVSLK